MNELVSLLPIIGIAPAVLAAHHPAPVAAPEGPGRAAVRRSQPGNEVMLSSGVFGVVERVDDDRVTLRIADGVTVEVMRGAVANVVPPAEPEVPPTTTEA